MTEIHREYSRRQFMIYHSLIGEGSTEEQALETVSAAARDPEWDLDEQMTWAQWEVRQLRGRRETELPRSS